MSDLFGEPIGDPLEPYTPGEKDPQIQAVKQPSAPLPDAFADTKADLAATKQAAAAGTLIDPFADTKADLAQLEGELGKMREAMPYASNFTPTQLSALNRKLADSPDPLGTAWKVGTAMQFARMANISEDEAYSNIDALSMAYTSKPYEPKTTWRVLNDGWNAGMLSYDMGMKSYQWSLTGGTDKALELQLDAMQAKLDALNEDALPRPWYIDTLKSAANSAPAMIIGATKGAGVLAGAGLLAASAGLEIGTGGLGTPLAIGGALAGAAAMASAADMLFMTQGQAYYQLRKQGHSHEVSNGMSAVSGFLQAATEGLVATIPGLGVLTGGGGADDLLVRAIAKRTAQAGFWNVAGVNVARTALKVAGEGAEEGLQYLEDIGTQAIAQAIEDVGYKGPTASEAIKTAAQQMVGGMLVAGVLGSVSGDFSANFKNDYRQAAYIKGRAKAAQSQGFDYRQFSEVMKAEYGVAEAQGYAPALSEWDDATREKMTRALWDAGKKESAATKAKAQAAQEKAGLTLPDISDEEGSQKDVKRTPDGRLYTQSRTVTTSDNGEIRAVFKLGDPEAKGKSKRLATIDYETDDSTLTIRDVSGKINHETKKEFILDLIEQNPGKTVSWKPKSEEDQAIYDELVQENPRGPEAGIQWYSDKGTIDKIRTRETLARQLRTFVGKTDLKAEQIPVMVATVDNFAKDLGMETDDLIQTMMSDKGFTADAPTEAALRQNVRGATSFERVNNALKSVVYFGQKADATTFFHEAAHAYQTMVIGNRAVNEKFAAKAAEIEQAFGVQNGDWNAEATGLWAEPFLKKARADGQNLSFKEAFSYAFEEYLRTGKAPTEEQRTIFQKIAQWFFDVYQAIAPKVKLNADITRVFDAMMGGKGPIAEIAQEGQEQPAAAQEEAQATEDREGKPYDKNATPDTKPSQPANTLEEVYALVEEARDEFAAWTKDIAEKHGLEVKARKELKARDRAARKITAEEGPETILDIDGKTLIAPDLDTIKTVMDDLAGRDEVVRIKDRYDRPAPGNYRDMLLNVKMSNGAIVEIQVTSAQMLEAKDGGGHVFYEIGDQTQKAVSEGKLQAEAAAAASKAIMDGMTKFYDAAFEATLSGASFKASDIDISEQLAIISEKVQSEGTGSSVLSEKTLKKLESLKASALSSQSTKASSGSSIDGVSIGASESSIAQASEAIKEEELALFQKGGPLIASAGSLEDIRKMIAEYWYDSPGNIELNERAPDLWDIKKAKTGKTIAELQVRKDKGRYRFEQRPTTTNPKAGEQLALFQEAAIEEQRDEKGRLLAPNGKPSALNDQQWKQVRTPAFMAWFGDWKTDPAKASKVVDENGEPRVVYHGTDAPLFSQFKTPSFFTEDIELAEDRSKTRQRGPARIDAFYIRINEDDLNSGSKILPYQGAHEYIVASPEQIKSATANSGAFDAENPSILYQGARDVERIVYTFPPELKGYSDIHSQAQVSGILNAFGRGVISPDGKDIRIGDAGTSHVGISRGMQDAKRFYFGYNREKQTVYVVAKNGMDTDLFKKPAVLQAVLSQVFDKYKLNVAAGKKLQFQDKETPRVLFQEAPPTDSPAFKAWFGESKVVDEQGKPLVVYHGTASAGFETFRPGLTYFSPDPKVAEAYTTKSNSAIAKPSSYYDGALSPGIYQAYLSIKKPFDTRDPKIRNIFEKQFNGKGGENWTSNGTPLDPKQGLPDWTDSEDLAVFIEEESLDYDGLILAEAHGATTYAPMRPEQIKSVNNRGTWDANDPRILYQPAYHGTPHEVEKFTTDRIGTGEGNQSYGWGLYFTDRQEIAEWYRDNLSIRNGKDISAKKYSGRTIMEWYEYFQNIANTKTSAESRTYYDRMTMLEDTELSWNPIAAINQAKENGLDPEAIKWMQDTIAKKHKRPGHTYKVEIPDPENMLDWDKTYEEQAPSVKEKLSSLGFDGHEYKVRATGGEYNDIFIFNSKKEAKDFVREIKKEDPSISIEGPSFAEDQPPITGGQIYNMLGTSPEKVSKKLSENGIPGIKYLDADSRPNAEGTYNYVIFSDDDVQITEVLYQNTVDDLKESAAGFKTWQEFRDYWESGFTQEEDDTLTDTMSPEDKDEFYRWVFETQPEEKPKETLSEEADDEDADEQFKADIKTDAGLRTYLMELFGSAFDKDFIRDIEKQGATDAEEEARYTDMKRAESTVEKNAAPTVYLGAKAVNNGTATSKILSSARGVILNNPTEYRRLLALIQGDQETATRLGEKIAKPYILDPKWIATASTLTIEKRRKLARLIRNEKVARKIARGDITVEDPELEEHLSFLAEETKRLRKDIAAKEAQAQELDDRLTTTQKSARKQASALREYQDRLALVERRAAKYLERQAKVSGATEKELALLKKHREKAEESINKIIAEAQNDPELLDTLAVMLEQVKAREPKLSSLEADWKKAKKNQEAIQARAIERKGNAYLDALRVDWILGKERHRLQQLEAERRAVKAARDEMKRLAAAATRPLGKKPHMPVEYQKKIAELQGQLDPNFRTKRTLEKLDSWRDFIMNDPGAAELMPDSLIKQIQAKPLNDWTLEEVRQLNDRITALKDAGRTTWKIRHNNEAAARELMSNDFQEAALAGEEFRPAVGAPKPSTVWTKVKLATLRPLAVLLELDGGKRGAFTNWLWDKVNDAWSETQSQVNRRVEAGIQKMEALGFTLDPLSTKRTYVGKEVDIDGFTYDNGRKPTLQDVLFWSIGMENEHTARAILAGNRIPDTIIKKAVEGLTDNERSLAKVISEDFDDNYGRLQEAFEYQYNMELPPQAHYVPMRRQEVTFDTRGEEVAVGLVSGTGQIKTFIANGFTKSRKEITDDYQNPIRTDLVSLWRESVQKEEAFIAQDWLVKRLQNTINRPVVARSIQQRLGPEGVRWMKKYLNDIAQGDANQALTGSQKFMQQMRGRMAVSYLSFNVLSNMKQLVSVLPYLADAGPHHIVAAAGQYIAGITGKKNKLTAFVEERSELIKNRSISRDFEDFKRMEAGKNASKTVRNIVEIEKRFGAIGMKSLEVIDHVSVCIGWKAVYDRQIATGAAEHEAIQAADDATVLTQPSGRVQDLAEIYRSGETMKLFTMFTNALNAEWNMMVGRIPNAIRQKHYLKALADAIALALCGLGIALASGAAYGDDDEEKKKKLIIGLFSQYTDAIPLVGSYVSAAVERGAGLKVYSQGGVNPFPWAPNIVNAVGALTGEDKDYKKAIKQAIEGMAYGLGLPVSGPKRALDALATQNPALVLGWKKE